MIGFMANIADVTVRSDMSAKPLVDLVLDDPTGNAKYGEVIQQNESETP